MKTLKKRFSVIHADTREARVFLGAVAESAVGFSP